MTHSFDLLPVILAAGKGSRLNQNQDDLPKALIKINEKPLLYYHLDNLISLGFSQAIIVIGYKQDSFRRYVGNSYKSINIRYVVNEDFERSGTAWSLFLTQQEWSASKNNVLFLHGDVFYDPLILQRVLKDDHSNLIVLDEEYSVKTNDEMVVLGEGSAVTSIFKGIPKDKNILGESLGINKWSISFMESFYEVFSNYRDNHGMDHNWELILDHVLKSSDIQNMYFMGIEGKSWVNINYQDDYEEAKSFIF